MDNEVLFCLQHSGPNNVLLRGETPLLGITNFSSMLRLRNGKSATGGRRTSETRELTTAVNAVAILSKMGYQNEKTVLVGFDIHETDCYFQNIIFQCKVCLENVGKK
jgi:hypothetical protein